MREFKVDLHIHTCLSPCADLAMVPTAIVQQAKMRHLDVIGICDHNSAENVVAVKKAGEREGVHVLGGMEITSREEVHIIGFFSDMTQLQRMQKKVYEHLSGENNEKNFGQQIIIDENDKPVGINDMLLIGATNLSVEEVVESIHELGGITIASHIDREVFGIIGHLGFIPEKLSLDALELSPNYKINKNNDYTNYDFQKITSSDAHYLEDIGKVHTTFFMNTPCFSEIVMAFHGLEGRKAVM